MLEIIKIPIKKITPNENNAKIHTAEQIQHIVNSIKEFGFNDPVGVWGEDNIIIEGHGRLLAAKKLKMKELPCIRLDKLTDEQRRAYTLAHNHINAETGFDLEILEMELSKIKGIDLAELGFTDFEDIMPPDLLEDEPNLNEIMEDEECIVKTGEIWQLGRHRLLCGDSTNLKEIERLMDNEVADICITDPPCEDFVQHDYVNAFGVTRDCLKAGGVFYIFHSNSSQKDIETALNKQGLEVSQVLVWVRNYLSLGRQDYQWRHEPIMYGWKEGAAHYFIESRTETTVIDQDIDRMSEEELREAYKDLINKTKNTVIYSDKPVRSDLHPATKPVPLVLELMRNSSKINELVIDFFGGSGTTLIAAEQCSRVCYMCEIDPLYCTRIIKRYESLTGEKARKIEGT